MTDPALRRELVDVDGYQVAVHIEGSGTPDIMLLHGFGAAIETWLGVLAPLGAHHRLIAFDRPGFGASPLPDEGPVRDRCLSGTGEVDAALAVLDHVGSPRAIVIGHSAGGAIAANVAIAAPARVAGLVLVDAAIGPGMTSFPVPRRLVASPAVRHVGAALTRALAPRLIGPAMHVIHHRDGALRHEFVDAYRRDVGGPTWAETVFALTLATPLDPMPRLDEIACPTLVITGAADRIVPVGYAYRLAEQIAGAALVVFPDSGHNPHEEHPADFVAAVAPFLADVSAAETAAAR